MTEYSSLTDLRIKRFFLNQGSHLNGCLDRAGGFGYIMIKPFCLTIKGLDNNYDFRKDFKLNQWHRLLGYMQHRTIQNPESPKQFVDHVNKVF